MPMMVCATIHSSVLKHHNNLPEFFREKIKFMKRSGFSAGASFECFDQKQKIAWTIIHTNATIILERKPDLCNHIYINSRYSDFT